MDVGSGSRHDKPTLTLFWPYVHLAPICLPPGAAGCGVVRTDCVVDDRMPAFASQKRGMTNP
jgi:hypothetical protein